MGEIVLPLCMNRLFVRPKIVAERLGHSTPMLTLTVYSHVTPTMQRAAANELDAALTGGSR